MKVSVMNIVTSIFALLLILAGTLPDPVTAGEEFVPAVEYNILKTEKSADAERLSRTNGIVEEKNVVSGQWKTDSCSLISINDLINYKRGK